MARAFLLQLIFCKRVGFFYAFDFTIYSLFLTQTDRYNVTLFFVVVTHHHAAS